MLNNLSKKLSANDLGLTGTHQAGILIPKNSLLLEFFPILQKEIFNPRSNIIVIDKNSSEKWIFNFIYYNNKLWEGTRNEYRLTRMTKYLRQSFAKPNDEVSFFKDEKGKVFIEIIYNNDNDNDNDNDVIILGNGWTSVKI